MTERDAEQTVDLIIQDMRGRQGGEWFDSCDKAIQREIREEWKAILLKMTRI